MKKNHITYGRKWLKCLKNTEDSMKRILYKMKRRKRRLNPVYWVFQFLGGLVAIGSLFFIPYLMEKILGG